ncbi:F0F1 ATP synthase subunit B [Thermanaeromonas toyohensis]|uniref:F0F1 ATP synthase subunit B n=1 Tax=Thermanaeromonas toyohensis TaxID=161154 RepID=UPI0012F4DBA7|nr:F0F1 ATP synthase subunit B [Thermanaeromonas toyohensis]
MEAIFRALNFNFWTFLWQVLDLLIVMGVLYLLLYKPLGKILAEREAKIEGSLQDAQAAKEKAEKLLKEYEDKLAGARREAQAIIERATRLGEEMREEILAQAREEANRTLEAARAEIAGEKARALAAIRDEAAGLAVLVAQKILERSLTPEDQERLLKESLLKVERLQ